MSNRNSDGSGYGGSFTVVTLSLCCCIQQYEVSVIYIARFPPEDLLCHGALCQGVNTPCSFIEQ